MPPQGFRNAGRQESEYVWDFAVDGGAVSTIPLWSKASKAKIPVGALILGTCLKVVTGVTTSAAGTLSFGTVTDIDGFHDGIAAATLADDYAVSHEESKSALLWDDTNDCSKALPVAAANDGAIVAQIETGALTAGKVILTVSWVYPSAS